MKYDPERALSMIATGTIVIEDLPVLIDFQYLITEALSCVSYSLISFVTFFSEMPVKYVWCICRHWIPRMPLSHFCSVLTNRIFQLAAILTLYKLKFAKILRPMLLAYNILIYSC